MPISQSALKATIEGLQSAHGNPSSITSQGRHAKNLLIESRRTIASFLSCKDQEIIFTSGGTESVYSLVNGICTHRQGKILTTAIEHKCVLEAIAATKKSTCFLDLDENGLPSVDQINNELESSDIAAIVLSIVNSEVGTVLPYKEIASLANNYNAPLILDGVAGLGKMAISILPGIAGIAFSGHKCHGPKGSGFFYLRKNTKFSPLFVGGSQEYGMRAGTENVPSILGLAKAIEEIQPQRYEKLKELRDYFEKKILELFPTVKINGGVCRISNVSNITFTDIDGDHLLIFLDQNNVIASLGSACSSGSLEPSHVLLGMGHSQREALSSIRFSFNINNTIKEIDTACKVLEKYKKEYMITKK